ncbi:hypothetical protein [Massilia sp. Se16.2.3]|uniref:hypothetical protein n=1 Tax=Massilia sp. Se16.2.3 TaxID=2709303 RepID=UPI001601B8B1|nr:hypothetical protein [Massilia sp. Se16.2.3]QNB00104.1 hypothetical protein G4G31_16915 [Massilia sp. Se16.2.3]
MPPPDGAWRRLTAQARTLYRRDDLAGLAPLGTSGALALPGEQYRLAFTATLLDRVYARPGADGASPSLLPGNVEALADEGGYVRSAPLKAAGLFPATTATPTGG